MSNLYRFPKDIPKFYLYESFEVAHQVGLCHPMTNDDAEYLMRFWTSYTKTKVFCSDATDLFLLLKKEIDGKCEYWNVLAGEKVVWLCIPLWVKMEKVNLR